MDIQMALKYEREKLRQQLSAIDNAIRALRDSSHVPSQKQIVKASAQVRTMSPAAKAKISKAAKARWAKYRAVKKEK